MRYLEWLNPGRWLLVLALVAAAWAWHWNDKRIGINEAIALVQAEHVAAALAASEAARAKESALQSQVKKVAHEYQTEKSRRAADAVRAAGKLRDLEAALDSASAADTSAAAGADDPAIAVARECARNLVLLDQYAQSLASQTRGLQAYARDVCMTN